MAGEMTMEGACNNDTDLAQLESIGETGLEEAIGGCVFQCLNTADPAPCEMCLSGATGLSDLCVDCFVDVTFCTVTNCVADCIDASSPACATCRETNCTPAFDECSGISTGE